ncbi:unnamed protein product [Ambrosiozyma monospora]|uniref:Unnamed protein product n=1 Tax=Ambrosiozyma monospora TaxID=43982 RepID=A0A9W6Z056_AMBMO|nr:unnamed protein product [Ambrosiozyma monospora]
MSSGAHSIVGGHLSLDRVLTRNTSPTSLEPKIAVTTTTGQDEELYSFCEGFILNKDGHVVDPYASRFSDQIGLRKLICEETSITLPSGITPSQYDYTQHDVPELRNIQSLFKEEESVAFATFDVLFQVAKTKKLKIYKLYGKKNLTGPFKHVFGLGYELGVHSNLNQSGYLGDYMKVDAVKVLMNQSFRYLVRPVNTDSTVIKPKFPQTQYAASLKSEEFNKVATLKSFTFCQGFILNNYYKIVDPYQKTASKSNICRTLISENTSIKIPAGISPKDFDYRNENIPELVRLEKLFIPGEYIAFGDFGLLFSHTRVSRLTVYKLHESDRTGSFTYACCYDRLTNAQRSRASGPYTFNGVKLKGNTSPRTRYLLMPDNLDDLTVVDSTASMIDSPVSSISNEDISPVADESGRLTNHQISKTSTQRTMQNSKSDMAMKFADHASVVLDKVNKQLKSVTEHIDIPTAGVQHTSISEISPAVTNSSKEHVAPQQLEVSNPHMVDPESPLSSHEVEMNNDDYRDDTSGIITPGSDSSDISDDVVSEKTSHNNAYESAVQLSHEDDHLIQSESSICQPSNKSSKSKPRTDNTAGSVDSCSDSTAHAFSPTPLYSNIPGSSSFTGISKKSVTEQDSSESNVVDHTDSELADSPVVLDTFEYNPSFPVSNGNEIGYTHEDLKQCVIQELEEECKALQQKLEQQTQIYERRLEQEKSKFQKEMENLQHQQQQSVLQEQLQPSQGSVVSCGSSVTYYLQESASDFITPGELLNTDLLNELKNVYLYLLYQGQLSSFISYLEEMKGKASLGGDKSHWCVTCNTYNFHNAGCPFVAPPYFKSYVSAVSNSDENSHGHIEPRSMNRKTTSNGKVSSKRSRDSESHVDGVMMKSPHIKDSIIL